MQIRTPSPARPIPIPPASKPSPRRESMVAERNTASSPDAVFARSFDLSSPQKRELYEACAKVASRPRRHLSPARSPQAAVGALEPSSFGMASYRAGTLQDAIAALDDVRLASPAGSRRGSPGTEGLTTKGAPFGHPFGDALALPAKRGRRCATTPSRPPVSDSPTSPPAPSQTSEGEERRGRSKVRERPSARNSRSPIQRRR